MLFSFLAVALLVSSPFDFEIENGISIEAISGYSFNDEIDNASSDFGIRLSYIHPDQTDAFVTGELAGTYQLVLGADSPLPSHKELLEASLLFYEVFNPYWFRLGLGGGVERRSSHISGLSHYRIGVGYFPTSRFSLTVDFIARQILRPTRFGDTSGPLQLTLSGMFIF